MSVDATAMKPAAIEPYAKGLLPGLKRQYDRSVNRDLSQHQWQDLFQRNVTTVLQQLYQDALAQLQQVDFGSAYGQGQERDRLTTELLQPFNALIEEMIQYALHKHRSSCALSNFPEEHNPSQAYLAQVLQVVERDWSEFVSRVTALVPG